MKKGLFADNISVETMAALTDEMLQFENRSGQRAVKASLLKLIPAAAAILLVVGLINMAGILPGFNFGGGDEITPGATPDSHSEYYTGVLTAIPRIVERDTFESLIERIPEDAGRIPGRVRDVFRAYYSPKDISDPILPDCARSELMYFFPHLEYNPTAFYLFDPGAEEHEIDRVLGYWNNYIGWSDAEYHAMLEAFGLGEVWAVLTANAEFITRHGLSEREVTAESSVLTQNIPDSNINVIWSWLRIDENGGAEIIRCLDQNTVEWVTAYEFHELMHSERIAQLGWTADDIGRGYVIYAHSPDRQVVVAGAAFGAESHDELYMLVRSFFTEQAEMGNMTQFEADRAFDTFRRHLMAGDVEAFAPIERTPGDYEGTVARILRDTLSYAQAHAGSATDPGYWNQWPWTVYVTDDADNSLIILTLKDGTEIITPLHMHPFAFSRRSDIEPRWHGFMHAQQTVRIFLPSGIVIIAPSDVRIEVFPIRDADHEVRITVGLGGATIINTADGSEILIDEIGTVIDGQGNIIRDFAAEQMTELQRQINAENQALEEMIRGLTASGGTYVGGQMAWPVDARFTWVSSPFGNRRSPRTGLNEFHGGIDIAGSGIYGTNIYAANDGIVIISQSSGHLGNHVVIDHGGGVTTLYGQAQELLASVGDTVTRGQVIATVGLTGASTGPHLHFEVAVNGTREDPLQAQWLGYR